MSQLQSFLFTLKIIFIFIDYYGKVDTISRTSSASNSNPQFPRINCKLARDTLIGTPKRGQYKVISKGCLTLMASPFLRNPLLPPSRITSTSSALLSAPNPADKPSFKGTTNGLKAIVLAEIMFKRAIWCKPGCIKGPPADKECALEPEGVATINPSAYKHKVIRRVLEN